MIKHSIDGPLIQIETAALHATIRTEGYTSGVAAGSLIDMKTGARDLGFGLSIVDFLLEPAASDTRISPDQYDFGDQSRRVHGDIPKRYVEGPQICTQAKKLPFEIIEGEGILVVRQWYTWHKGYAPYQGGSRWEQTLVFTENARYFFSADRVTAANACPSLFFRVDMPGHIKHKGGDSFEHIYLSYPERTLPSTDFAMDFAPDHANLYQRGKQPLPDRFIRAYQVRLDGKPGPWLAGMTLETADVYEAWCHQRGYVCMIQELGGWPTKPGTTFGAAYIVGWFDDVAEMKAVYDRHRGWSGIELRGPTERPLGIVGAKQKDLAMVKQRI